MSEQTIPTGSRMYPVINIPCIQNPNRLWAFPIFGFLVKIIILIPVGIWIFILGIAIFVMVVLINPFVVLFTGKYWDSAFPIVAGYLRLNAKLAFFLAGLTDKYPGFSLEIQDNWSVGIDMPKSSNRLYAIPVLGGFIRIILLIPYFIWEGIIGAGAGFGYLISFVTVLFRGKYPETTYELYRDYTRLSLASGMYLMGLTDTYPSFWISKNHLVAKIIIIVLGVILQGFNMSSNSSSTQYDTSGTESMQKINNYIPQNTTY